MTNRREFLGMVAASTIALAQGARAQPAVGARRIGFLRVREIPIGYVFWDLMREFGWTQGQNLIVEARYAANEEQLPDLARELVQLNVDMIITNGTPATKAAMQATKKIPIVFFLAADPIQNGVVSSLSRPDGNATGFAFGLYAPKLLEALKMGLPSISRVAVPKAVEHASLLDAARAMNVKLIDIPLARSEDIDTFFVTAQKSKAEALLLPDVPWFGAYYPRFAEAAARAHLPSIGPDQEFPASGGLMSYGPAPQHWRALAPEIDKILKGANPGTFPVLLPTRFELVINKRVADLLGVTFSKALLARVDDVVN